MNKTAEPQQNVAASRPRLKAGQIAKAYEFDAEAITVLIADLAIGNGEPEMPVEEEEDPYCEMSTFVWAMRELEGPVSLLPGAMDPTDRTTVSMLASVLENRCVDQLHRIADALKSVPELAMARPRRGPPMHPRPAMLIAKLGTFRQFWLDWKGTPPDGGFVDTEDGLMPEPGSAVAMFVDCLKEAGCDYRHAEIRDAQRVMAEAIDLAEAEAEAFGA